MWWYPHWYLVAGRKKWNVIWIDPTAPGDPRVKLEAKLGRLDGFEPIEGAPPMHVREMLQGMYTLVDFPERKRGQRNHRVEMVAAVQ